jgi:hypothetical protein
MDTNSYQYLQWTATSSFPRDGQGPQIYTSTPCNTRQVSTAPIQTPTGGNEKQSRMSAPEPTKKDTLTLLHVVPEK